MRGIIYTRARNESLLQAQLSDCRQFAENQAISIDLILSDIDDGTTLERPGLSALRSQAAEHQFEVVIVYDYFSLSRRLDQARGLTRELLATGVKVRFVMS